MRHRIAAGALVVESDRLLLVHHRRIGAYDFWVAPGGGVLGAEELPQAASREVAEETGLVVEVVKLAYVEELVTADERQCKFWYFARRVGGAVGPLSGEAHAENIVEVAFLSRGEMIGKTVFPPVVLGEFWGDLRDGFTQPKYLGVREAVTA
jgi:8-oxo-dGTP diphosphatase